ncbi:RNA-directed DNA polymerase, eukaryota, reverse transcriptase zinc-binding domain protein [Tanacetum coccineum]|uniref:RNA-directed DNA polymerase, eukaryota, reverse transcriptase zinc-binding domain protein n=1 Tax=Tanacetum coccineum TaxID=301880 RepID=A0ABQ5H5G0_9ASTR
MLAQELFKGYDRKVGPKRVALKVDIQKAYDTVNWQFLKDILEGFSFHDKMVDWIMTCVTTTSFSICVNGESCRYFKGGRGLRQGRLMLVASVLESIHIYWDSVILLPDGVIKDINRILKDFLWNHNDGTKGSPKVAWKHEIEEDKNDSWGWRNLLKQINDVRGFIVSKLGNGEKVSLWFDNWSNIGPLDQFINYRAMYDGRFRSNLIVKEWMEENHGVWPDGWTCKFLSLLGLHHAYKNLIADEDDIDWWKVVWTLYLGVCLGMNSFCSLKDIRWPWEDLVSLCRTNLSLCTEQISSGSDVSCYYGGLGCVLYGGCRVYVPYDAVVRMEETSSNYWEKNSGVEMLFVKGYGMVANW